VSEHAGTITCPCQKCAEAARARAQHAVCSALPALPALGRSSLSREPGTPLAGVDMISPSQLTAGGSMSSTANPSPRATVTGGRRSILAAGAKEEATQEHLVSRDFVWLLRVMADAAAADPADADQKANSRYSGFDLADPKKHERSLQGLMGVMIPETVVLEKGKPRKRYVLDAAGRVQVTRMKTSAELLRVLREFVKKATKPRVTGADGRRDPTTPCTGGSRPATGAMRPGKGQGHGSPSPGAGKGMRQSRSEGSLSASLPAPDGLSVGFGGPAAAPLAEVAVLHYNDGMSRLMMCAEALSQMKGASKLPR
ncbi:unnamed protein product, partial [Polarella glacialis]